MVVFALIRSLARSPLCCGENEKRFLTMGIVVSVSRHILNMLWAIKNIFDVRLMIYCEGKCRFFPFVTQSVVLNFSMFYVSIARRGDFDRIIFIVIQIISCYEWFMKSFMLMRGQLSKGFRLLVNLLPFFRLLVIELHERDCFLGDLAEKDSISLRDNHRPFGKKQTTSWAFFFWCNLSLFSYIFVIVAEVAW